MELILIRHGLPLRVENTDGSPADPGLSVKGVHQAEKLAVWMKNEELDAIYCSPLKRARMTAQPLVQAVRILLVHWLLAAVPQLILQFAYSIPYRLV